MLTLGLTKGCFQGSFGLDDASCAKSTPRVRQEYAKSTPRVRQEYDMNDGDAGVTSPSARYDKDEGLWQSR